MKPLALVAALFLSLPSLFAASADLRVTVDSGVPSVIRAGFHYSVFYFTVHNEGPDTATGVKFEITSTIPIACNQCDDIGPIRPGDSRSRQLDFDAPAAATTITITATATSSAVSDPNPGNNKASATITISAAPDIELGLGTAQATQDLALPFKLIGSLSNLSKTTAHDVDVTIDFNPEVAVRTLPAECSNPAPGRIACRFDTVEPSGTTVSNVFQFTLVAPPSFGSGKLVFSGRATEREQDFNPVSNNNTATVGLYATAYVTTTANDGAGSLREAINQMPSLCSSAPCTIAFRIDEPSATPWKTIRITSPLPIAFAPHLRIDGATQTGFFGDTNPDGPEIEISGGGTVDGDGLVVTSCGDEVANLAINGFRGNGVGVATRLGVSCQGQFGSSVHHLYVGTDPTGSEARPNGRGIATALGGGDLTTPLFTMGIRDSVISGNTHSGVFGLSGRLVMQRNRIGVKARADEPLPNGNAGVYVGPGSYGSDIGAAVFDAGLGAGGKDGNVIAFNGQMGIAVDGRVGDVAIRDNRIWGNGGLGIDVGLDGATPDGAVPAPVLTLAHYDPVSKQTVVEGDLAALAGATFNTQLDFYASDAPALSGAGEAQRLVGERSSQPGHFQFKFDGDLTGQFISVTATRVHYIGFDQVGSTGLDQGFLTQTSEISRPIEVR